MVVLVVVRPDESPVAKPKERTTRLSIGMLLCVARLVQPLVQLIYQKLYCGMPPGACAMLILIQKF